MVTYECKICNYKSIRKNQYERHLKTNKHINREKEYSQNINTYSKNNNICVDVSSREDKFKKHCKNQCQNNIKERFICCFCNNSYSTNYNLNKHIKKCKQNPNNSNENLNYKALFETMYKEVIKSNKELVAEKDKRIEEQERNKNDLLYIIQENNNNTKLFLNNQENLIQAINDSGQVNNIYNQTNNLTNTNYVLQFFNYSEADSMDKIKDKFRMTRDEFIKASSTTGYRGALLDKADQVIIQPYLEAQSKRPIHTVDTSRKKALYKDDDHDKWTFNPKTTLSHCFNVFHKSALEHQDRTIRENPEWLIHSYEDNLYKQTYFIPAEIKEKESIFRDVKNHIYKETKVNKNILNDEDGFLQLTECLHR